jgi:hypothetical protein
VGDAAGGGSIEITRDKEHDRFDRHMCAQPSSFESEGIKGFAASVVCFLPLSHLASGKPEIVSGDFYVFRKSFGWVLMFWPMVLHQKLSLVILHVFGKALAGC